MTEAIIQVENLGKRYVLGRQQDGSRYHTLREGVMEVLRAPWRGRSRQVHTAEPAAEEFWALKDVSFEIKQGEVVGIIGRNGAGKSTLLKVLSRITEPTTGRIHLKGRVASLLEVGTGFHPELSGRENIYLNGAILGMSRAEIKASFDEIVAFAEVEKFLDTPVKRYSSGMYVRLAFAVAAHLEPEILVIDEVLAVGDIQFQKKCVGKIHDISSREGRTVLFVSHHMGAILQLCTKGVVLRKGSVAFVGQVKDAVDEYMHDDARETSGRFIPALSSASKANAIISAESLDSRGTSTPRFTHDEDISVTVRCRMNQWVYGTAVRLHVKDAAFRPVFTSDFALERAEVAQAGIIDVTATIPGPFLRPGTFFLTLALFVPRVQILDLASDALSITVIDGGSEIGAGEGADYGCVFAPCQWTTQWHESDDSIQLAHAAC